MWWWTEAPPPNCLKSTLPAHLPSVPFCQDTILDWQPIKPHLQIILSIDATPIWIIPPRVFNPFRISWASTFIHQRYFWCSRIKWRYLVQTTKRLWWNTVVLCWKRCRNTHCNQWKPSQFIVTCSASLSFFSLPHSLHHHNNTKENAEMNSSGGCQPLFKSTYKTYSNAICCEVWPL